VTAVCLTGFVIERRKSQKGNAPGRGEISQKGSLYAWRKRRKKGEKKEWYRAWDTRQSPAMPTTGSDQPRQAKQSWNFAACRLPCPAHAGTVAA